MKYTETNYTAMDIAAHIIKHAKLQGQPVSNLKLQHLLFWVWIAYVQNTNKHSGALFPDKFESWENGPVVPGVYCEYAIFGGTPIAIAPYDHQAIESPELTEIISNITKKYRDYTAGDFLKLCNTNGHPWKTVRGKNKEKLEISQDLMQRYTMSELLKAEAAISHAKPYIDWIDITKDTPPRDAKVFVFTPRDISTDCGPVQILKGWMCKHAEKKGITHWAPYPEYPEEYR